jgi:hypothetical protein
VLGSLATPEDLARNRNFRGRSNLAESFLDETRKTKAKNEKISEENLQKILFSRAGKAFFRLTPQPTWLIFHSE